MSKYKNIVMWEMKEGRITSVKFGENVFNLKDALLPDEKLLKKINDSLNFLNGYISFDLKEPEKEIKLEEKEIKLEEKEIKLEEKERVKYMQVDKAYHKFIDNFGSGIFTKKEADKILDRNSYFLTRNLIDKGKIMRLGKGKFRLINIGVKLIEDLKYKKELFGK